MISNFVCVAIGLLAIILGIFLIWRVRVWVPILICICGVIAIFVGASYVYVPSGYVGIRTLYGQISDKPVSSGLNWKIPFTEQIHMVNCKQTEIKYKDKVWSETSERTELYCEDITIDYQIDAECATWIWQNVEEYDTHLIKSTSIESGIKAATKQYSDTDVTDRSKIEKTAKECIQANLNNKYGKQVVDIISVSIGNMNFSDAYNEAIEKNTQIKLATEAAKFENEQMIEKAQAEAEKKRIDAEAQAEAKRIWAEAEAEANKKIAESLTPELVEKMKIEKWDGVLPKVSGSGYGMIVDIGDPVNSDDSEK